MAKYQLLAFTNPVAGQEDEFNTWYNGTHVPDLKRHPGVLSAVRYKVADCKGADSKYKYLAVYEVETDLDPDAFATKLLATAGTDEMYMSPAFDFSDFQMLMMKKID